LKIRNFSYKLAILFHTHAGTVWRNKIEVWRLCMGQSGNHGNPSNFITPY
jgi:hypothetical protein